MASLLALTDLKSSPVKKTDDFQQTTSGYKTYNEDDYMTFITTSNVSGLSESVCNQYDNMLAYRNNPVEKVNGLTNPENLREHLEIDPVEVSSLVSGVHKQSQDVNKTVAMACYLNSGGLSSYSDQTTALHNHFAKLAPEKDKRGEDEEERSNYELFASIDDSSKLLYTASVLNREQMEEVLKKADEAAKNNPQTATKNKNGLKVNEEHVLHDLKKVMTEGRFNSLTALNELMVQYCEPEIHIEYFLRVTDDWEEVEPNQELIQRLETNLYDKTVNTTARLITCREELYNIVMPLRFRLHEQDSTPAIDVYTQQLLGAQAGFIRSFYELSRFSDLAKSENSTDVINTIDAIMKIINNIETQETDFTLHPTSEFMYNYTQSIINEWARGMCFVIYVEIIRNLITELMQLEIAEVDKGLDEIKDFRLFYYKGFYYGKVNGEGFVSKCFKSLLSKLFESVTKNKL